jgi:hypothetical protein
MNGYELSRNWFDWSFENPELITPTHTAIYFFAIEHCNRLGWKDKFGFPTQMAMDAIGVRKHQTFTKHFTDLVEWGFIGLVQKSKNQYSANIISLKSAMPKNGKALDKAMIKHGAKQSQSTGQSMDSIDKQETNKQGTINVSERKLKFASTLEPFQKLYPKQMLSDFYKYWGELNKSGTKFKQELEKTWDLERRLEMWARRDKDFNKNQTTHSGPLAFSSKTINK